MKLWRCDICFELIDPAKEDDRTELEVTVSRNGHEDTASIDLCEDCAPEDAGRHMDWLTHTLEDERAQEVSRT